MEKDEQALHKRGDADGQSASKNLLHIRKLKNIEN